MSENTEYPGSSASVEATMQLADEYCRAAQTLLECVQKGKPLSRSPFRLCAVHAIELYLNALLLHCGDKPGQIRGRKRDLAERTRLALESGLKLRGRTAGHLVKMTETREYLVSRYDPEMSSTLSEINRLEATLNEVGKKVREIVHNGNLCTASAPNAERDQPARGVA